MLLWSPYNYGLLHSGLSEYLGTAPLIAVLWALSKNRVVLTGVLLGLCGWQAFYYAIFAGLAVPVGMAELGGQPRSAVSLVSFISLHTRWLASPHRPGMLIYRRTGSELVEPNHSTMLLSWFHPGEWYHPDTQR